MSNLGKIFVRAVAGIDMSGGVLVYILVTLFFSQGFSWLLFGLTLVAVHAPDADFIPYLLLKKRLPYPSHRLIGHHPLLLLPLAGVTGWAIAGPYGATLATSAVMFHFLHDSAQPHGLHWFSPFTWWSMSIYGGHIRPVPEVQRVAALQHLRLRIKRDGGEVLARMPALRTGEIVFCIAVWIMFAGFFIRSTLP